MPHASATIRLLEEKESEEGAFELYAEMPTHSAYRSGQLVQRYKAAGGTYTGPKPKTRDGGLPRWFAETWRNQSGKVGYQGKETPKTFAELSPAQIHSAFAEIFWSCACLSSCVDTEQATGNLSGEKRARYL